MPQRKSRRLLMRGPGRTSSSKERFLGQSPTFEPGPGDRWHALTLVAYLRCSRFWTTRNLGYTGKLAGKLLLNWILKGTKSSFKLRVWHFENFLCSFFFERVALSSKPQTLTPNIIILGQNICGIALLSLMDNEYGSLVIKWVCDRDSAQTRWSNLMKFRTHVLQRKISDEFVIFSIWRIRCIF